MIEILPDLWICKNKDLKKIDDNVHLINCSDNLKFIGKFKDYHDEIKQKILKYEILKLYKFVIDTINYIDKLLLDNKNIIVSCSNSLQFSPLVIIAYLIKFGRLDKDDAINFYKTKKPDIYEDDLFFHNILNKINNENNNN
jgi:hypothetical protein